MLVLDLKIACRINKFYDVFTYASGLVEVIGECSLTGKIVIRHLDNNGIVYEFEESSEKWVELKDGVCKNHFNHFAAIALPRYYNNVLEYKKKVEEE